MKRLVSIVGIYVAFLVLCVPLTSAQDGLRGALSQTTGGVPGAAGFAPEFAAADFDNDLKPDGAVLSKAGWLNGQTLFRIDLHVTAGLDASISFPSAERELAISAMDVNRDGAPDIVVEKAFTHERLQVYLNDGHGAFERRDPKSFSQPDDSAPLSCSALMSQNPPLALLPPTRPFELAALCPRDTVPLEAEPVRPPPGVLWAQSRGGLACDSRGPPFLFV